jgi:hypothetical protein
MNKKEITEILNNMEYPCRISKELRDEACKKGIIIVYGASDDLICFDGAIRDEAGCYNGGEVLVDAEGFLPDFGDIEEEEEMENYFVRKPNVKKIEALWCKEDGYCWTYKTDIPHETFEIMEDGENYCRGIVFYMADL